MPKIGVVLSGCGFLDGAEIHEATLTLLHLDNAGADIQCIAPDDTEFEVIDHYRKEQTGQRRSVIAEAGRIARTQIIPASKAHAADFDGVIFPGGSGAAKNLCNWAGKGPDCKVEPEVERLIREMHKAKKPLGFICIAPVLAARVLGDRGVTLTVGTDVQTAARIEKTGAHHQNCPVDECVADQVHRVVTTPAYMLGPSIGDINKGIKKLVDQVMTWTR
jgi:enhancing lycopene biosynthesis protein 2